MQAIGPGHLQHVSLMFLPVRKKIISRVRRKKKKEKKSKIRPTEGNACSPTREKKFLEKKVNTFKKKTKNTEKKKKKTKTK